MNLWHWIAYRASAVRISQEIDAEIQHHIEMRIAEYRAEGLTQREARSKALRRFGDTAQVTSVCRSLYRLPSERSGLMESVWQDLKYALRSLIRQPSFAILTVVTLATGIAASTIIFSAVNSTLLHPIPFEGGDRWVIPMTTHPGQGFQITPPQAAVGPWREQARTLEAVATYQSRRYLVRVGGEPRDQTVAAASVELLPFLGVQPILGRGFIAEDTVPGRDRVALLSERLWRQRYGADRDVLGSTITLDDESYTIIGVLPRRADAFWAGYLDNSRSDMVEYGIWVPGANMASTVARLRPGVDDSTAMNDLRQIHAGLGLDQNTPDGWPIVIRRPIQDVDRSLRTGLWVLLGAVWFVLLVACVNVANMILARGLSRRHELAVRTAVGAGRIRVFRQMVVESLLLTVTAAALALILTAITIGVVRNSLPPGLADLHSIRIDSTVLFVTSAVAILTGLLFGLVPAGHVAVINLTSLLSQGHRSGGQMSSRSLSHGAFVTAEVALAMVLFVGAGLMVNSLLRLQRNDPGLNPANVISFNVDLPESRYADAITRQAFFRNLLEGLRESPAVARAAIGGVANRGVAQGAVVTGESSEPFPARSYPINWVSDDYMATLGMRVTAGREFSSAEITADATAVMVNESLAQMLWPGENAAGRRFRFEGDEGWYTVLGVFESVELSGLSSQRSRPQFVLPYPAFSFSDYVVTVRTNGDSQHALPLLKGVLWSLDPDLPMQDIEIVTDMLNEAIALPRFNAFLLVAFAVVTLGMAAVGVYGVVSLSLQHRMHELGVRMALGATKRDVFGLMLSHGMRPVLFGATVGLGGAFGLSRFLGSLLFEVEPTDPVTYAIVAALLGTTALGACYLPSLRACSVDPVEVLRNQ
jgi:putative ABC transport system permease protein